MDYINKEDVLKWLKENLDEERFEHSIGVSETAVEFILIVSESPPFFLIFTFYTCLLHFLNEFMHL